MSIRKNFQGLKNQTGIALLIFVITIALSAIAYTVSQLSGEEAERRTNIQTQKILKLAKQALIAFAVADAYVDGGRLGKYGFLPCPDLTPANSEGVQDGSCDGRDDNSIGWLPSVTLGLPRKLTDGTDNCLLYAVTGAYKQSLETEYIFNEDTNGQFKVVDATGAVIEGALPEDQIVAIVFSPGVALPGQNRVFEPGSICGKDYDNIAAYLEGDGTTNNATILPDTDPDYPVDKFIRATLTSDIEATNPYNDKFITITRKEIWNAIFKSEKFQQKMTDLTEALAKCIASYANGNANRRLPWPARIDLAGGYNNDIDYTDENDVSTYGYAGRYPYVVNLSNTVLGITPDELFKTPGPGPGDCAGTGTGTLTGDAITLSDGNNEYHRLWQHWKDHFFYVLSKKYKPELDGPKDCGDCVSVDGTDYAGIVFFANDRINGADRSVKTVVSAYLDGDNSLDFPDMDGVRSYTSTTQTLLTVPAANDIMFCITDEDEALPTPLSVVSCD